MFKQRLTKALHLTAKLATVIFACSAPARADIGSELTDFWTRSGGASNVTRPSAYMGQQAGYVTGGSLILRTKPRNSNIARLTLPRIRAGCGGIDMYMGSFSFLSAQELIAMMEAIMQNAPGFAFELALESLSPAIQETVNNLRDLAQKINNLNINSCEQSQALVASIWPKHDNASQHICKTVGVESGLFADVARSRHGCGSQNQQNSTLDQATDELKDQVPIDVNYAWKAIQKHPYLASEREVAELMMTLSGTIITRKDSTDPDKTVHDPYPPKAFSPAMVTAFIEGGSLRVLKCDTVSKCLNPTWQTVTISADKAFFARVKYLVQGMSDAIKGNTAQPAGAAKLIGLTSTPVFATLVEATASRHIFTDDEVSIVSELVAIELAMHFMQAGLKELSEAASKTDVFGDMLKEFQNTIRETTNQFGVVRNEARESYRQALSSIERLGIARSEASALSTNRFASSLARN